MTYEWLTGLPAALDKWGVDWVGVGDWQNHAAQYPPARDYTPVALVNHHTAGTDRYDPPRLANKCNLYIDPDGLTHLLSLGYQYDTGYVDELVLADIRSGVPPRQPTDRTADDRVLGNQWCIDIEVGHWGLGQPIPKVQRDALILVNAAIVDMQQWTVDVNLTDHKGMTRRKIDVNWTNPDTGLIDTMAQIRADTRQLLEADMPTYRTVLNVPDNDWATDVVDWGIDSGVIVTSDTHPDDWANENMTDGRMWTLLSRLPEGVKGDKGEPGVDGKTPVIEVTYE